MKKLAIIAVVSSLVSLQAFAASAKTYQVTGPVLEVSENSITVQKGKEKWEIARDASTQVKGEIKKGDKVTVMYSMTAASIEAKGGAEAKADAKGKKSK